MMTIAQLAQRSGMSERTIADIERGRSGGHPETLRCLAKTLGIEPEELLRDETTAPPVPAPTLSPPPAPPPPAPPSRKVIAIPPPKHAARTRLDSLADFVRERGDARAHVMVGKARVDVVDAPLLQAILARHAVYAGKRFVVVGVLMNQRALSVVEARALGTKVGVGARFDVAVPITPTESLSVTVHATTAKLGDALHATLKQPVSVVVALRVVGKNDARVVSLFASARKRAWAFVVERVV